MLQYLNDPWTVRKEIIADFRAQVSSPILTYPHLSSRIHTYADVGDYCAQMHKIVVQQRVSRRMAAIKHKLEQGGLTGGSTATLVDVILAADMGGDGGGGSASATRSGRRSALAGGGKGPGKLANLITLEKVTIHTHTHTHTHTHFDYA
jgi:hypothetical protein